MVVLKLLEEFAGGTSIHGFKFLVSPNLSRRSKIIWAISLVVAVIYASYEMGNSVIGNYHYFFRSMKYKPMITITVINYLQIHLLQFEFVFYEKVAKASSI